MKFTLSWLQHSPSLPGEHVSRGRGLRRRWGGWPSWWPRWSRSAMPSAVRRGWPGWLLHEDPHGSTMGRPGDYILGLKSWKWGWIYYIYTYYSMYRYFFRSVIACNIRMRNDRFWDKFHQYGEVSRNRWEIFANIGLHWIGYDMIPYLTLFNNAGIAVIKAYQK